MSLWLAITSYSGWCLLQITCALFFMSKSVDHQEKALAEDILETHTPDGDTQPAVDETQPDATAQPIDEAEAKAAQAKVDKENAKVLLQAGQLAFERGNYRASVEYFEEALTLVSRGTVLGGEVQLWLANAYSAMGDMELAIATCQKLARHPDPETRKQGKRLAYILQAPKLQTKEEWLTKIPDLKNLDGQSDYDAGQSPFSKEPKRRRKPRPKAEPEPIDLSQVNTKDNQFVWFALIFSGLVLGGLWWLS